MPKSKHEKMIDAMDDPKLDKLLDLYRDLAARYACLLATAESELRKKQYAKLNKEYSDKAAAVIARRKRK